MSRPALLGAQLRPLSLEMKTPPPPPANMAEPITLKVETWLVTMVGRQVCPRLVETKRPAPVPAIKQVAPLRLTFKNIVLLAKLSGGSIPALTVVQLRPRSGER